MADFFKKHIIDAEGNYKIGYWHNNKFQKFVDEDKPLYVEWLGGDNTPDEVDFVAKPLPAKNLLIQRAKNKAESLSKAALDARIWEASNEYADLQSEKIAIENMTIDQLKEYLGL